MTRPTNTGTGDRDSGDDSTSTRVVHMNTANAENWENVPFPARQQLGDPNALSHKFNLTGPVTLGSPEQGGHRVLQVPHHPHTVQPRVSSPRRFEEAGTSTVQQEIPGRNQRAISGRNQLGPTTTRNHINDVDVPDGSIRDVLDWVGDDPNRVRAAIRVENRKQTPRRSLLDQLNDKLPS